MPSKPLTLNGRDIQIHKAILDPKFTNPTVLTSDFWKYVELWLRRKNARKSIFYWSQAQKFYKAAQGLDDISAPLPYYYCFLNAVKALLEHRGVAVSPFHGTFGKSTTKKATLSGEKVTFASRGVAPALSLLLSDTDQRNEYSLKQILYNLVFIHRAFVLTFTKEDEIFVPLKSAKYVQKDGTEESWLEIVSDQKFDINIISSNLPAGLEPDIGAGPHIFRTKKRFKWKRGAGDMPGNLTRISNVNSRFRKNILYIRGQPSSWYLKLPSLSRNSIDRSNISLMLGAMHRLSELARYDPLRLQLLLETQQNWLISEFIGNAPIQFLDEISTEITGENLATPFVRASR